MSTRLIPPTSVFRVSLLPISPSSISLMTPSTPHTFLDIALSRFTVPHIYKRCLPPPFLSSFPHPPRDHFLTTQNSASTPSTARPPRSFSSSNVSLSRRGNSERSAVPAQSRKMRSSYGVCEFAWLGTPPFRTLIFSGIWRVWMRMERQRDGILTCFSRASLCFACSDVRRVVMPFTHRVSSDCLAFCPMSFCFVFFAVCHGRRCWKTQRRIEF